MRKIFGLMILAALPLLGGCAAAVIGGAATGVLVAQDRRTVGTVADDQGIEIRASSRVNERVPSGHYNFTSYNKMLLITGEVANAADRENAERAARTIENVRGVYNELQIAPVSALTARTNDSFLTSKIKTRFLDAQQFNPIHVKVVTEASVVYLMGLVKRTEGEQATELARTTSGVQKVVRLFEYID